MLESVEDREFFLSEDLTIEISIGDDWQCHFTGWGESNHGLVIEALKNPDISAKKT